MASKAQGQPFQQLQQRVDELRAQIEAIQLAPGLSGPAWTSGSSRDIDKAVEIARRESTVLQKLQCFLL
jgi:phage shock protein A